MSRILITKQFVVFIFEGSKGGVQFQQHYCKVYYADNIFIVHLHPSNT